MLYTGILMSSEESLFYYKDTLKWSDFHYPEFIPTFDPKFMDPELETQATELCNGNKACLFDVAATGRLDMGNSALLAKEEQNIIASLSVPSKLMWLCEQAGVIG